MFINILFAMLVVLLGSIAIWNTYKVRVLSQEISKLMAQKITNFYSNTEDEEVGEESFLKFISDSREWAFEYIEDVQTGIKTFVDQVDHDIEYFDQYGEVIWTPLTPTMQNISAAYKDLKNLLPKDTNGTV